MKNLFTLRSAITSAKLTLSNFYTGQLNLSLSNGSRSALFVIRHSLFFSILTFAICFLSFTFYSKAQTITLGSNAPSAANQCAGTTKVVIQSFSLEVTVSDGNLTDVGFTTTGTYVQADIIKKAAVGSIICR